MDQTLPIGRILLNLENMDDPKDQPPFSADWTSRIYMFETQLYVLGICFNGKDSTIWVQRFSMLREMLFGSSLDHRGHLES